MVVFKVYFGHFFNCPQFSQNHYDHGRFQAKFCTSRNGRHWSLDLAPPPPYIVDTDITLVVLTSPNCGVVLPLKGSQPTRSLRLRSVVRSVLRSGFRSVCRTMLCSVDCSTFASDSLLKPRFTVIVELSDLNLW